jgi:hypothetical protein
VDDKTLQKKLNQMARLGTELNEEAVRRYGPGAGLFHEADGSLHIMSGDSGGSAPERQEFIEFTSSGVAIWGAGAW